MPYSLVMATQTTGANMSKQAQRTPEQIADLLGCTVEQLRAQYAKGAAQFSAMAEKAERTGGRVNGYTLAQLRARAESQAALAKAEA